MRYSALHAPTLKQDPADAEVVSHRLLVRGGFIRQVARGIYDILPLGLRSLRKIERIIRDELDRAGCQELLLPIVSPAELWQESGRWEMYGKELLRLADRHGREFCFGPTHEEVITDLVRRDLRSYRELPLNLYQIQTKFRDEVRPRFGLMRGREFIMKDGYSFHADREDCQREYENMYAAYSRIFERCGLTVRVVEADTGNIGGSMSHEFQVLADSGEDLIVSCDSCEYAANVEKAELAAAAAEAFDDAELTEVDTPGASTIEEVSGMLGLAPERFVKTLIFTAGDGTAVAALVRGDDQLSEPKLRAALGADELRMASDDEVERATGAAVGFAGPVGLGLRTLADHRLVGARGMATGANKADTHLVGVAHERDFGKVEVADLRTAGDGDGCGRCGKGRLQETRGIEVGQVFYLGTKYSSALGATYLDADGKQQPIEMGTYGIGVTRTMAAAVEQNHDERGMVWPVPIAPFEVVVVPAKWEDQATRDAAEKVYAELLKRRVETVLDDRDERAGVKFNDADLIGIPFRITVGPRGLAEGKLELTRRNGGEQELIEVERAAERVAELVAAERT
ncbi:MAG: proline--tRNA ligase [Deltaproteobacteria bacterium]